ncbi:MFS transporter [Actinomadura sp. J1-007]|nr:MFS transporter [Actinomadura sp. J1-007]
MSETRPRLVNGPLAVLFVCSFTAMTGFYLLFSVVPLYATSVGAGGTGAGFATGALMLSTVAAEFATPRLTARYGHRPVLAAGFLLLGLPALALPATTNLAAILGVSLVRGVGFAIAVVVCGALVAEFVPAERRGEGLGLSGVVIGVPNILALPAGVWLADHYGYTPVFVAAAASCLVSFAACLFLPRRTPRAAGHAAAHAAGQAAGHEPSAPALGVLGGLRTPALLRPSAVFGVSAMAVGVIATFLPTAVPGGSLAATALLVQATASTFGRWWAGRHGDRHGAGRLLLPGALAAAAGMAVLVLVPNAAAVVVAMLVFGLGFGVAQNASLAVMFERVRPSGYGTVSAIWNVAYDTGMGVGGAGFGLLAARTGYPPAFALTGVLIFLALPLAFRDRRAPAQVPGQDPPARVAAPSESRLDGTSV